MTAIWGPMGWMTLHSISVNYPENPSSLDIQLLNTYMDAFGECITCPHCKQDFASMFPKYKSLHPEWSSSRYNLFLAILRMHNTVNRKLDKPSPKTVAEALQLLKNATLYTKLPEYRQNYIDYVSRFWKSMRNDPKGIIALKFLNQMEKLNTEYWSLRESDFNVDFPEAEIYYDVSGYSATPVPPTLGIRQFIKGLYGKRR